jgi:hypothetical protein
MVVIGILPIVLAQAHPVSGVETNVGAVKAVGDPQVPSCYRLSIVGKRVRYIDHLNPDILAKMRSTLGPVPKSLFEFASFRAGLLGRVYAVWLANPSLTTPNTAFMIWSAHDGLILKTIGNGDFWLGSKTVDGVPAIIIGQSSQKIVNSLGEHASMKPSVYQWSPKKQIYIEFKCMNLDER